MKNYFYPVPEDDMRSGNAVYKGLNYILINSDRLVDATDYIKKVLIDPSYIRYLQRVIISGVVYDIIMAYFDYEHDVSIFVCTPLVGGPDVLSNEAISNLASLG